MRVASIVNNVFITNPCFPIVFTANLKFQKLTTRLPLAHHHRIFSTSYRITVLYRFCAF